MLVIRMYCGADAFIKTVRMLTLCKRRLLFLEAVRMGRARRVCFMGRSGWGWPRWQMGVVCHCQMRATCLGGRGPYKVVIFQFSLLNYFIKYDSFNSSKWSSIFGWCMAWFWAAASLDFNSRLITVHRWLHFTHGMVGTHLDRNASCPAAAPH